MRLTSADLWEVGPGRVHLWTPRVDAGGPDVPLSVNQANHLAAVALGSTPVWLAVAIELPGWNDVQAARRAVETLLARHPSLQVATRPGPLARRCPSVTLVEEVTPAAGADATARVLLAGLERGCRPLLDRPALAAGAVVHGSGTTLVCAFDHTHVDAVSLLVVLDDLAALLPAETSRPEPLHRLVGAGRPLRTPGSFLEAVDAWASAPALTPADPRLRRWSDLLDDTGDDLPSFPFDLGLDPGDDAPQRTRELVLADPAGTGRLAAWARAAGASTYAGCLATLATAVRDLGRPGPLPVLVPVETRRPQDAHAIGWFTTTVPVLLPPDPLPGGAAAALAAGLETATLPLDQVLRSLPRPLRRSRRDVFMVSYLDYRRLPAHDLTGPLRAAHVSSPVRCDDVQTWIARTPDGLRLRVRHPATAVADAAVGTLLEAWRDGVRVADDRRRPAIGDGGDERWVSTRTSPAAAGRTA